MRISVDQGAQPLPEGSRGSGPSGANPAAPTSVGRSGGNALGEDQAQLSGEHTLLQALTWQAAQLPEIRQERVGALRQVIAQGSYSPAPAAVAEAVLSHLAVKRAA